MKRYKNALTYQLLILLCKAVICSLEVLVSFTSKLWLLSLSRRTKKTFRELILQSEKYIEFRGMFFCRIPCKWTYNWQSFYFNSSHQGSLLQKSYLLPLSTGGPQEQWLWRRCGNIHDVQKISILQVTIRPGCNTCISILFNFFSWGSHGLFL